MTQQVHIVPHMHWDREWYFSAEESKLLLLNNMEEIMQRLETDPNYPTYTLDGQTAIIEDYLSLKPENKDRFKKLVNQGRLIIGPWYTQTDEMVVGGESIVRNLLYGHIDCLEYNHCMKIGYLPDSFGQSAQMPMILNGFDIHRSMFWRGTSERKGTHHTEFYWKSDDGSQVLTQLLPLGYAIGKYLPTDKEGLKERCSKYMPVLEKGASTNHLLVPNGHDQMPLQKNINDVIFQLHSIYPDKHFFLSSYENLFEELEKHNHYPTLHGEFLDGKYMRVHRSIFSSRNDIKCMNTLLENKMTHLLEPIASIAYTLGVEYYHGFIESIWKEMLKNHAHDSIGCCCSDAVHNEIYQRFLLCNERIDSLIEFYKRKMTDSISNDISLDKVTVFNLLPYDHKDVIETKITTRMKSFKLLDQNKSKINYKIINQKIIDPGLIDRQIVHYGNYDPFIEYTVHFEYTIPSMGYETFFVLEDQSSMPLCKEEINHIENAYYSLKIHENGSIDLFDKQREKLYENLLIIEESGDDGDGYDYSPPLNDLIITSKDVKANISIHKEGLKSTVLIQYTLDVPYDLNSRKNNIKESQLGIKIKLELFDNQNFIHLNIKVNNTAKDHRVRLLIPSSLSGKNSVSDNQFGIIKRSVYDEAMKDWEKENWSERPDSIYPMLSYVSIEDSHIAIITHSTREFEIINNNYDTLALTLFRSVGFLGKEELVRRPHRPSGIKMETPDSQLIKEMDFDLSLTTYDQSSQLSRLSKECLTPLISYNKMPYNAMKMNSSNITCPYSFSLFKELDSTLTLSTLKKSEFSKDLILRMFNTTFKDSQLSLTIPITKICNLNEKDITFDNTLKHNQVKSFIIEHD